MNSPDPTHLIVEADGGSRGNPGPAAFGALVRDAGTGRVLFEVGETLGVTTNNVAEYRGLLAGLRAAHEIAPEASVEARLDSKLVVEQMSGRWSVNKPELRRLAAAASQVYPAGQVAYVWVPRAENAAADALLNRALDGAPTRRYADDPPATATPPRADLPSDADSRRPDDATRSAVAGLPKLDTPDRATAERGTPDRDTAPTRRPRNRLPSWSADELGPPTRLYLVRHGHTAATVARQFSGGGVDGPGLTEAGLVEARRAGEFVAAQVRVAAEHAGVGGVAAIVASPTTRTMQTADAIGEALGCVPVQTDDGWREADFGAWEGLTLGEVTHQYPEESAAWHDSVEYAPPGGESLEVMTRRIAVARDRVVARHPGRSVVVVTHSMPIRALVRAALEAGPAAMFRLQPAPGSVTLLDVFGDGTPVVTSVNIRP